MFRRSFLSVLTPAVVVLAVAVPALAQQPIRDMAIGAPADLYRLVFEKRP